VSISSPEAAPKAESRGHSDRNYWLVLSLLSLLFIAFTAFAEGFRLPGWYFCKPAAIWAAYPLQFILLALVVIRLIAVPSRKVLWAWSALLLVTLGLCLGGYRAIEGVGRKLVQWEVSPAVLANDCLRLVQNEGRAAGDDSPSLPPAKWPASIRRMRPMYVTVGRDRIGLELHGGFEHYGYIFKKAAGQSSWVLEWYNIDANAHETMATIPAADDPGGG